MFVSEDDPYGTLLHDRSTTMDVLVRLGEADLTTDCSTRHNSTRLDGWLGLRRARHEAHDLGERRAERRERLARALELERADRAEPAHGRAHRGLVGRLDEVVADRADRPREPESLSRRRPTARRARSTTRAHRHV